MHVLIVKVAHQHVVRYPAHHGAGGLGDTRFDPVGVGHRKPRRDTFDRGYRRVLQGCGLIQCPGLRSGQRGKLCPLGFDAVDKTHGHVVFRQMVIHHATMQARGLRPDGTRNQPGNRSPQNARGDQPVFSGRRQPGAATRVRQHHQAWVCRETRVSRQAFADLAADRALAGPAIDKHDVFGTVALDDSFECDVVDSTVTNNADAVMRSLAPQIKQRPAQQYTQR